MLHRAGSCRCWSVAATGAGGEHGVALDVPGQGRHLDPLPRAKQPKPGRQELVLPPQRAAGYLRGLVGHHHALPSRHRVIHVLGQVVAFHPDEVAGGG